MTAPAAMPSVEEIQFVLAQPLKDDDWVVEKARAILALFAPILAEKERDNRQLRLEVAEEKETSRISIYGWRDKANEMEGRALAAEAALAKAVVFELGEHHYVESRGDGTWAIKNGGCVLNIDGEWEWEPSPSNRTDEFIARTRFDRDDAFRRAAAIRAQGE